jgi:hypothetical protein
MKKTKKLRLSRETLAKLSLTEVHGAAPYRTWSDCPMISCDGCTPQTCPP